MNHTEQLQDARLSVWVDYYFTQTQFMVQGGTCMLIGDDHTAIDKAGEAIQKALGCRVVKRKKFYREAGYDQVSSPRVSRVNAP